jgi:hypothetical protein
MKFPIFTLRFSLLVLFSALMPLVGCKKEQSAQDIKLQKYAEFKKSMLQGFNTWSNAYLEASEKNFGKSHSGNIDVKQFQTDFNISMSKNKQFVSSSMDKQTVTKLQSIKPWKRSEETLDVYLERNNASPAVAEYVVKMNNHIEKVVSENSEMKGDDLNVAITNAINLMQSGISKIEEEAINDSNLSETEVFSIIAASSAIEGMSKAISTSAQMFFKNLNNSLSGKLQTRCFFCFFAAIFNVVATIVVAAVTLVINTAIWIATTFYYGLQGNFSGVGQAIVDQLDDMSSWVEGTFGWLIGQYTCYIPHDGWNCP